ncbi:MAG: (2Fe-2S)-binding protein [Desulfitobacteriaceae bacterium]
MAEKGATTRREFLKLTVAGVSVAGLASAGVMVIDPGDRAAKILAAEKIEPEQYRELVFQTIHMNVNGQRYDLLVDTRDSLAEVLRNQLNLTGTKISCDRSECGACTVLMDDIPVYSCSILAVKADGHNILTIEGLSNGKVLHSIQQAFLEKDAYQCGFCTSGQIMALVGFLKKHPTATEEELRQSNAGNLCRCGSYANIHKVALEAAKGK